MNANITRLFPCLTALLLAVACDGETTSKVDADANQGHGASALVITAASEAEGLRGEFGASNGVRLTFGVPGKDDRHAGVRIFAGDRVVAELAAEAERGVVARFGDSDIDAVTEGDAEARAALLRFSASAEADAVSELAHEISAALEADLRPLAQPVLLIATLLDEVRQGGDAAAADAADRFFGYWGGCVWVCFVTVRNCVKYCGSIAY